MILQTLIILGLSLVFLPGIGIGVIAFLWALPLQSQNSKGLLDDPILTLFVSTFWTLFLSYIYGQSIVEILKWV